MTATIRLSDEQAQALEARAASEGLSVQQWTQKLVESGNKPLKETRTGADLIAALQASPYRDVDIEPERYRFSARGVTV